MAGYLVALDGVTAQALKTTAMAIIQGQIDDISAKVCPLPPELSRAVRKQMLEDNRQAQLATPRIDYVPLAFVGIEMRRMAAEELMRAEGRKKLCSVDSHPQALEVAKSGKVPPGSLYVGILGAFYSPKPEDQHATGTVEQPEPEPAEILGQQPEDSASAAL